MSKNKAVEKTKKAPKKVQKAKPKKVAVKKPQQKKTPKKVTKVKKKSGVKTSKVQKVKKVKPNKGPKNIKKVAVKPVNLKKKSSGGKSRPAPKRNVSKSKSKGHVQTYKSPNFKSTVSSILAKGGGSVKVKSSSQSFSSGAVGAGKLAGGSSATLKKAKVSQNVGSLTGASTGKLDTSRGVEGLVEKKGTYTVGIPTNTVVLGSMDPDIIRRILLDHAPQFRSCYQRVLDRSKNGFQGVVPLEFIIGPSGHVTKAGIGSRGGSTPGKVKRCLLNVLRGIRFPEPMGGGKVGVKQALNLRQRRR